MSLTTVLASLEVIGLGASKITSPLLKCAARSPLLKGAARSPLLKGAARSP